MTHAVGALAVVAAATGGRVNLIPCVGESVSSSSSSRSREMAATAHLPAMFALESVRCSRYEFGLLRQ